MIFTEPGRFNEIIIDLNQKTEASYIKEHQIMRSGAPYFLFLEIIRLSEFIVQH